ncbi:MAG TPA: hypothetical protein VGX92_10870 [Pyrinomonadaceae bacterium]|jgi:hypothetical protein|nr:hypothetical protein [Pyrinomonadaceae bacterium]
MSENEKPNVNTNTAEFKQGVEAGLNSEEDTRNWQAGNKLGQALKSEDQIKAPVEDVPLFLKDGGSDGRKGNAQDEKDGMEE